MFRIYGGVVAGTAVITGASSGIGAATTARLGIEGSLTVDDLMDPVSFAVGAPHHVNIHRLIVRPPAQAARHKMHRSTARSRIPAPRLRRAPTATGLPGTAGCAI